MVQPESRMLIDGKLVEAASGATFDNVNPATEEVIGQVADASTADMRPGDRRRPPGVRRDRLVDRTTPSGKQCLEQLQDALEREQEELREQLILEVGCPRMVTHGPQLDAPLERRAALPGEAHRRVPVGSRPRRRDSTSGRPDRTRRSGRSRSASSAPITPWNFPFEVIINKVGQALADRQHRGRSSRRRDTPWNATRSAG